MTAPVSHEADDEAGFVEYLGYVVRPATGPALDLGVTDANVFGYKFPKHRVEYQEIYAGLIGEHLSFRAHYSPNYFHTATQTPTPAGWGRSGLCSTGVSSATGASVEPLAASQNAERAGADRLQRRRRARPAACGDQSQLGRDRAGGGPGHWASIGRGLVLTLAYFF